MIVVNDAEIDVFDFIIRCKRQNNKLHDGHHEDYPQYRGVAEYLRELFLQQKFERLHVLKFCRRHIFSAADVTFLSFKIKKSNSAKSENQL